MTLFTHDRQCKIRIDSGLGGDFTDMVPVRSRESKLPKRIFSDFLVIEFINVMIRNHFLQSVKYLKTIQKFTDFPTETFAVILFESIQHLLFSLLIVKDVKEKFPSIQKDLL